MSWIADHVEYGRGEYVAGWNDFYPEEGEAKEWMIQKLPHGVESWCVEEKDGVYRCLGFEDEAIEGLLGKVAAA